MGCSDSKPEEPVEGLQPGDKLKAFGPVWLMSDERRSSEQETLIDAGVTFEFLENGTDGEGAERIKVRFAGNDGWIDSWVRRGASGNGPKDSKIKRWWRGCQEMLDDAARNEMVERRAAEAKAKTEAEKEAALKAEALAKEAAQKAAAEKEAAEKAKARQDAAQKQKQQGVEVGFGVPGQAGIKTVFFTRRPLGFDFHHEAPITVYKVAPGSHAEEVGVGKGWIVKVIQGQRVDRMNFEAKYEKFMTAVRDLPGGVEVVFELPDKSERAVQFRKRPVGFDFHQESPIKVDSVFPDSHAAQLGIQLGWIVLRINGESMVGKAYEANYQHFVNALKSLPDLPDSK